MSATKTKPTADEAAIVEEIGYAEERQADAAQNNLVVPEGHAQHNRQMQVAQPDPVLAMIERASRDPTVDMDKFERLMQMRRDEEARRAKIAYFDALSALQPELPIIERKGAIDIGRGKPQKYARWEDINEQIREPVAKHGFCISFRVDTVDGGLSITAILGHREGHSEDTTLLLPFDTSGSKNTVQARGSTLSYGKRYTAGALLNLVSRLPDEVDEDGAGGKAEPITDDQLANLHELLIETKADEAKFRQHFKIDSLSDLTQAQFPHAIDLLQRKKTVRK